MLNTLTTIFFGYLLNWVLLAVKYNNPIYILAMHKYLCEKK